MRSGRILNRRQLVILSAVAAAVAAGGWTLKVRRDGYAREVAHCSHRLGLMRDIEGALASEIRKVREQGPAAMPDYVEPDRDDRADRYVTRLERELTHIRGVIGWYTRRRDAYAYAMSRPWMPTPADEPDSGPPGRT